MTLYLNAFPSKNGISQTLTPRNIIDALPHLDYNMLTLDFGTYVRLSVDEITTNGTNARTIGAIALDPKGTNGNYNFMLLETGKEVHGRTAGRQELYQSPRK